MYRGTTPTLRITIKNDIDLTQMKDIWVTIKSMLTELTFKMSEGRVLVKDIPDETGEMKKKIVVELTQQDTLSFATGEVSVQLRLLDMYDKAYASSIVKEKMNSILKEGIMYV